MSAYSSTSDMMNGLHGSQMIPHFNITLELRTFNYVFQFFVSKYPRVTALWVPIGSDGRFVFAYHNLSKERDISNTRTAMRPH